MEPILLISILLYLMSIAFSFCETCPFNMVILPKGLFAIYFGLIRLVELEISNTYNSRVIS
jgi:hypothetical protein